MSDSVQTFSLNIHLVSFHLPEDVYNNSDDLRVGITTLPEHNKSNFILPASKISYANHVFTVNVQVPTREVKDLPPNATRKIIVSFRKKTVFSNPMIASAIIRESDFPKISEKTDLSTGIISGEMRKIDIYEPINQQIKELKECKDKGLLPNMEKTDHNTVVRKTIGYMEVQLTLCPPMEEEDENKKNFFSRKRSSSNLGYTPSNNQLNNSNSSLKRSGSLKIKSVFSKNNNADESYHHFD